MTATDVRPVPDRRLSPVLRRARSALAAAAAEPVERAALGLVLLSVAIWCAAASRSYFRQDDFVYFYRATEQGFGAGYLFQDYGGHLMPGQFAVAWALATFAPLHWPAAVAVLAALRLAASLVFVRVLVDLFGRRPAVLLPLGVFLFCPLAVTPVLWWAAGLQLAALQLAFVLAIWCHVRYLRTGRWSAGAGALAAVAAGLLFWQKAVLVPVVLGALSLLLPRIGLAVAPARRGWYRGAWAVLVGGYLAGYLALVRLPAAAATPAEAVRLVRETLLGGFLPGLVGGPWSGDYVGPTLAPAPSPVPTAAVVAVFAAVVGWSCRRRFRAAGPAWLLLFGYLGIEIGLIAGARLEFLGATLGRDARYVADAVLVAALTLGLAVLPLAGVTEPARPAAARAGAGVPARLRRVGTAVRPALLPAYVLSCLVTVALAAGHAHEISARSFVDTARAEVARQPGATVWDGIVPNEVIGGLFLEDARVSRVVGWLPAAPRFDQPTEDLRMFDGLGQLRPVDLVPATTAGPGDTPSCGHAVRGTAPTRIALLTPAPAGKQAVRFGYYSADTVAGTVGIEGGARVRVVFQQGLHHLYLAAAGGFPAVRVTLDETEGTPAVCVTEVIVGQPWPKAGIG